MQARICLQATSTVSDSRTLTWRGTLPVAADSASAKKPTPNRPCRSPSSTAVPASAWMPRWSRSRCISPTACRHCPSSGCRKRPSRKARTGCVAPSSIHRFDFPARRITINLAPADLPKEGGRFDLAIALGILAASRQIPDGELQAYEFAGELALSGELRAVQGILPMTLQTCKAQRTLVIASANVAEATLVKAARVIAGQQLLTITAHFTRTKRLDYETAVQRHSPDNRPNGPCRCSRSAAMHGAPLRVAAAGAHSLLLLGPPGTGKSLLASRLPGILPEMSEAEALEAAAASSRSAGCRSMYANGNGAPSVHRTIPPRPWHWSAAVPVPAPVRSRSRITACCFWMNWRNSIAGCWRSCASRWRAAAS